MRDEDKTILVILAIIVVGGGLFYAYNKSPNFFGILGDISSDFFYDPYLIEDDFSNEGYTRANWELIDNNFVRYGSGKLMLSAKCDRNRVSVTYKKNLKNKDIKLKVEGGGGISGSGMPSTGTITIYLGTANIGSFSMQGSSKEFLVEVIKDVTDKNKFVVLINGGFSKEITIQEDTSLLRIEVDYGGEGGCYTTASFNIYFLKYQPYFSCQADNNEIWISDNFGEGSTFDIHSLTYEPTKFCPQDYPSVVRDFRERGVKADYRGTITEKITRGISFKVPTFQSYEIRYATTYKEGMGTRCGLDEVLYIDKAKGINKCVKKIYEQDYIIKDCNTNPEICPSPNICKDINNAYVCMGSQTVFRDCNTNPEICTSPNNCQLRGGVYICVTTINTVKDCNTNPEICTSPNTCKNINGINICTSSTTIVTEKNCLTNPEICDKSYGEYCDTTRVGYPVCVRPYKVVEIIRDREIIIVGKNQKLFTDKLEIGNKAITTQGVSADTTCLAETTNNNPKCFTGTFEFDGKSYSLKYGEKAMINDYFEITSYCSGRYDFDDMKIDLTTNSYLLTIKNFDFIQIEPTKGNELDYYVIKGSSKNMCFKIINNLGIDFNSEQAGYSLKKTTDLITMQTTSTKPKLLSLGITQFCIPIDVNRYGEIFYQINPYIKIGDEIFFDNEQIVYNYKIVDEVPKNETTIYKTIYEYREGYTYQNVTTPSETTTTQKETNWWLYGGIAFIIILLIFILTKKK